MKAARTAKSKQVSQPLQKLFAKKGLNITSHHVRRLFFIYATCIIISACVALSLVSSSQHTPLPDPFSAQQRTSVPFTLYYPKQLPGEFYVDIASVTRVQEHVVAMRITDGKGSKGQSFTISQQAAQQDINLEAFYSSFAVKTEFLAPLGKATAGTIDGGKTRIVSLITKDKTWFIAQAPANITLKTLQDTFESLAASR